MVNFCPSVQPFLPIFNCVDPDPEYVSILDPDPQHCLKVYICCYLFGLLGCCLLFFCLNLSLDGVNLVQNVLDSLRILGALGPGLGSLLITRGTYIVGKVCFSTSYFECKLTSVLLKILKYFSPTKSVSILLKHFFKITNYQDRCCIIAYTAHLYGIHSRKG